MRSAASKSLPVIRPLTAADLGQVISIERASYPYPWTKGIFEDCLKVGYSCFGGMIDGQLVAYEVHNRGADEAHLLNLCVHPEFRSLGLGRLLLQHAIDHARAMGCMVMFLEVRPSNAAAIQLYREAGFDVVGRRPSYYPAEQGREDAVVMRLALLPAALVS